MTARVGVLLMAHGTPSSTAQMPEYLRLVRGGRPAPDELIAEMGANYEAIGGRSPLTDITMAQAAALGARLGPDVPVAVGMRNWLPFIKDAVADLARSGVTRVIGIPMTPQFSSLSVQKYVDAARVAIAGLAPTATAPGEMPFDAIESYHTHPLLLEAFAERVREARPKPDELLVFTAHALPRRVIDAGDPYAEQVAATARGVASRAGFSRYRQAYQSAGRTPEPWIGPDIADVIDQETSEGVRRFLVVPIGFLCDHTEILFDIDIKAARTAREFSTSLRRTESLNTSPLFISLLEQLVRERL